MAQGPANEVLAGASSLAVFDDWTRVHCNHIAVRQVRPHPLGEVLMRVSAPGIDTLPGLIERTQARAVVVTPGEIHADRMS